MTQLERDVRTHATRRRSLGLLGGALGGLMLGGCARAQTGDTGCIAFPSETAGPFPADGRGRQQVANVLTDEALRRSDIRTSFGGLNGIAEGVPLTLELMLVDSANGCKPMAGAALYIWQCDAPARYSLYEIAEQNYLRGMQVADASGTVRFTSIFPGCYGGRLPHIHFELFESASSARDGSDAVLTSQIALPADVSARVYQDARYPGSTRQLARLSVASDGIFHDNSNAQIAAQTLEITGSPSSGLRGVATIGYLPR